MLNIGVESFVCGGRLMLWSGRECEACRLRARVLSGQRDLAKGAVQSTARQEALNGLRDEAAHDALSLDVDRGMDLRVLVVGEDVVGDVHLDERPDCGQPQRAVARLV